MSLTTGLAGWFNRLRHRFVPGNVSARRVRPSTIRRFRPEMENLESRELLAASIMEFGIPTANSGAIDITRGPDGSQWFAEELSHKIGRISATGSITEYAVSGDPVDLWAGVGSSVWFSMFYAGKVGVIDTTTGQVNEYTLPTAGAGANGITLGADSNVWVGEYFKGKIARITPTGQITEFTVGGNPTDLALGGDGRVFFTSYNTNQVGAISTSGVVTWYNAPSGSGPAGIAAGLDGNLYVTLYNTGKVAKVTTSGSFTEYSIPTANSRPWAINAGTDGTMWTVGSASNRVIQFTTSGQFQEYVIPTSGSDPRGIAASTSGSIWWTEYAGNKIGTLTNPTVTVTAVDPTAAEPGTDLGVFQFHRTGDLTSSLTVSYSMSGSTASSSDYQETLSGSIAFAANQADVFINITPLQDDLLEGTETVALTVNPGLGYIAGVGTATVSIADAPYGTVSGSLFNDRNGDGQQQTGDSALNGWTVQLLNSSGQIVATTQTATDGTYQFTNVLPGTYTLQQVVNTGWTQTAGLTETVSVHGGGTYAATFGAFENIRISGWKFDDRNGDSRYQSSESGLAGWTIELYTVANGQVSATPLQTTTTDAYGEYRFENLGPLAVGTSYAVKEVLQPGWTQTAPAAATTGTIVFPDGSRGYVVAATSGVSVTTGSGSNSIVSTGVGSITLNGLTSTSITGTVRYNDGLGHSGTVTAYLSQFSVTLQDALGNGSSFYTYCIDPGHRVSIGQTYAVNVVNNLTPTFANASQMAYIYQHYGTQNLANSPLQAAAVALAEMNLALNNQPMPTYFLSDGNGGFSSGSPDVFYVSGISPELADLVDRYLGEAVGASTNAPWLDAASQGEYLGRGQSLLLPETVYGFGNHELSLALDDFVTTSKNTSLNITSSTLLVNDLHPAADAITLVSVTPTSINGGIVFLNSNGTPDDASDDFVGLPQNSWVNRRMLVPRTGGGTSGPRSRPQAPTPFPLFCSA